MEELGVYSKRMGMQQRTVGGIDPARRLVTFQADKGDCADRIDEIRKKYLARYQTKVAVQNPEPNMHEKSEGDRDDSPINWINKLGRTPESSPQAFSPSASLPKGQKPLIKLHQVTPPPVMNPSNAAQLGKIDEMNKRIRSILQSVKDDQKEIPSAKFMSAHTASLKTNSNTYNVRPGYQLPNQIDAYPSKTISSNFAAAPRREDSENRYPSSFANSPKNGRKSKNKLPNSELYRHEITDEAKNSQLIEKIRNGSNYSALQKERRLSYGGDYSKLQMPAHYSKQAPDTKPAITSRRSSIHEEIQRVTQPMFSARLQHKHQHISVIDDCEDEPPCFAAGGGSDELKKLVSALKAQVELDRKLRSVKYSYNEMKDKHKAQAVISSLHKMGVKLSQQALTKELHVSEAEYNPFCRSQTYSFEDIAQAYKAATDHWAQCIRGKFSQSKLLSTGIKQQLLFTDRTYLAVQDFVRLLNDESEGSLRNRDLILMYRRLTSSDKLSFDQFMKVVCHS